jgi:membrane fusion protein (multidrug efflux system)
MPQTTEVHPEETTPKATAHEKEISGGTGNAPAPASKVKSRKLPLLLAAAFLAVGALLIWRHYAGWISTDDADIEAHLHPVSARIAGDVIKVMVDNTDYVEKGAVLVELDPADYRAAVNQAEGQLAEARAAAQAAAVGVPITSVTTLSQVQSAQAAVESAQAGIAAAERQFEAAEARLREAEANNVKTQADLRRYANLVVKHEVSRQQYDHAVAEAKGSADTVAALQALAAAAHRQVSQAESHLVEAQSQLNSAYTRPKQLQAIRARAEAAAGAVQTAEARLEQAELNLEYTTIVASVSGVVGNRTVVAGENVAPGQTLLSIVPTQDIWVTANFKETALKQIRPGDPALIHVDAYGRDYRGRVFGISQATGVQYSLLPPENATGNWVKVVQRVPVKIVFDPGQDPKHLLRVGLSVEPRVKVNGARNGEKALANRADIR